MNTAKGTNGYMLKLAVIKSISSFPISYALNAIIIIPLVLILSVMGISPLISGIIISIPFVVVSILKNYTFFWIENKYTITLNPKIILTNLRRLVDVS